MLGGRSLLGGGLGQLLLRLGTHSTRASTSCVLMMRNVIVRAGVELLRARYYNCYLGQTYITSRQLEVIPIAVDSMLYELVRDGIT